MAALLVGSLTHRMGSVHPLAALCPVPNRPPLARYCCGVEWVSHTAVRQAGSYVDSRQVMYASKEASRQTCNEMHTGPFLLPSVPGGMPRPARRRRRA